MAVFSAFALSVQADITPNILFQDNAVLQRGIPVPIWGTAAPSENVTVRFREHTRESTAATNGSWRVDLPPMEPGEPGELLIEGENRISFKNVVVGEVWVGSGQSNMWGSGYPDEDPQLKDWMEKGPYPQIRIFRSPSDRRSDRGPLYWQEASPTNLKSFSALLFCFGLELNRKLDVPVGLILASVSGTPSGAWLSQEAIDKNSPVQNQIASYQAKYPGQFASYEKALAEYEKKTAEGVDVKKPNPPPVPGQISLDEAPGQLYECFIRPIIPYAIRGVFWDQGEGGTGMRDVGQYEMMGALIRGWRSDWGQGDFPFLAMQKPSGGGCAWDPQNPSTMHASPFEELPEKVPNDPLSDVENYLRLSEYPSTYVVSTSDLCPPLGSGDVSTHPRNKSGGGIRATHAALQVVYGLQIAGFGPTMSSVQKEGSVVRVKFENVGDGLAWKHGSRLQGFALAGRDGQWYWADGSIEGQDVLVSSAQVPEPVKVKHALSPRRTWANLFRKNGLPAVPFQSTISATNH
jgi:sialate O-acetylesterase